VRGKKQSGQTTQMPRISLPTWSPVRFKAARQAQGWTLEQLAATADLSYGAVAAYAAGSVTPSPEVLVRLADALGVPTTDLAPLSDQPSLHELRWHAGLTVAELAHAVGLSRDYVSRILRGAVEITQPDRWAAALNTTQAAVTDAWNTAHARLNRRT
jgi:transcriptional regulator with XRE-family HTH domain